MTRRSTPPGRATRGAATLLLAAAWGTLPIGAHAEGVRVLIANADELVAASPDPRLAADLMSELGESDLWHANVHADDDALDVVERTILLVAIAAPDEITTARQDNASIQIQPVEDFSAFVDAIDYGEVLAKDEQRRMVRVKIDPVEITADRLIARGDSTAKQLPPLARRSLFKLSPRGGPPGGRFGRGARRDAGVALGEQFEEGDAVEIDLGGQPHRATVVEVSAGFRGDAVRIRLESVDAIAETVRDRRLRTRLQRAGSLTLTAPSERLRKARLESTTGTGPRTWTDKSGNFRVEASYGGVEEGRVRLKKRTGKEILVPINRLSEADQRLIDQLRESDNPFAESPATTGVPGSLRADWSEAREIAVRGFLRWSFEPPKPTPIAPAARRKDTLPVSLAGPDQKFSPTLDRLYVAPNGGVAIAVSARRGLDPASLQLLDFTKGVAHRRITLPARSELLDASADQRLILLKPDKPGSNTPARLYVYRLTEDGIEPYADWITAPVGAFHKDLDQAFLLAGGKVMTRGFHTPWVVWEADTGKALYYLPQKLAGGATTVLDPRRRYAVVSDHKAVFILDTSNGEHVATVRHALGGLASVAVSDDMTRLAMWANDDSLVACDLTTGGLIFALNYSSQAQRKVEWMGDLLLAGNRYLIEPAYPIVLWKYGVLPAGRGQVMTVNNRRLWYAPSSVDLNSPAAGSLFVGSVDAPHKAVLDARAALPDPEDLVILSAGDEIRLSIDTSLGPATEAEILEAVSASLTDSGFRVVNEMQANENTLDAVVVCRPSGERQVEIVTVDPKSPHLAALLSDRGTPVTLTPFESYVSIRRGDDELWSDVSRIEPGQRVYGRANETADQVIERITSPNVDRLLSMEFPSQICRRGDATPEGAYGLSVLSSQGIEEVAGPASE